MTDMMRGAAWTVGVGWIGRERVVVIERAWEVARLVTGLKAR